MQQHPFLVVYHLYITFFLLGALIMDKKQTLSDVLDKWQTDPDFRTTLEKTTNTNEFKKVLEAAEISLSAEELKKVEAMLHLKNQKSMNIDLDKKINK